MIYRAAVCLGLICSLYGAGPVPQKNVAQQRVNPRNAYVRIVAVVPLIGTGSKEDPIRPDYVPAPAPRGSKLSRPDPAGIIGFHFVMSDDKKHAIVEYVARDRSAFNRLMADRRPDVKVFDKGRAQRSEMDVELKKHKTNINLDQLMVRVP
jgi:hypothetical protein